LIAILIYERMKIKGSLDFGNQGLFMKIFLMFLLFACFFSFLNNKTKIRLSEQEKKSVGALWRRWITTKTINLS